MKGTLDLGDPRTWWVEALDQLAATHFSCGEHISEVYALPPVHKDPFDRALIEQGIVEQLTRLTTDEILPDYANDRWRVLFLKKKAHRRKSMGRVEPRGGWKDYFRKRRWDADTG